MEDLTDIQKIVTDVRILKNEVKQVADVNTKLDSAIDKLTDISSSIKSMLAVHEERLSKQEDIDKAIFNLMENRRVESESKFEDLHARLNKSVKELRDEVELSEKRILCDLKELKLNLSDRVGVLEKYRWIIIGASIILGLWFPQLVDLDMLLK
jgi:predicted nuclease with TOPRIM domain